MSEFAKTPQPPYYVVVFTAKRTSMDATGYLSMAETLFGLLGDEPGFLGIESARDDDGFGITAAYFKDEAAILRWKNNTQHLAAQRLGQERWYDHYEVRVARVERAYGWGSKVAEEAVGMGLHDWTGAARPTRSIFEGRYCSLSTRRGTVESCMRLRQPPGWRRDSAISSSARQAISKISSAGPRNLRPATTRCSSRSSTDARAAPKAGNPSCGSMWTTA